MSMPKAVKMTARLSGEAGRIAFRTFLDSIGPHVVSIPFKADDSSRGEFSVIFSPSAVPIVGLMAILTPCVPRQEEQAA